MYVGVSLIGHYDFRFAVIVQIVNFYSPGTRLGRSYIDRQSINLIKVYDIIAGDISE